MAETATSRRADRDLASSSRAVRRFSAAAFAKPAARQDTSDMSLLACQM